MPCCSACTFGCSGSPAARRCQVHAAAACPGSRAGNHGCCVGVPRGDRSMLHGWRLGRRAGCWVSRPANTCLQNGILPQLRAGLVTGWERAGVTGRKGTRSLGVSSKRLRAVVRLQPCGRRGPLPLNRYCRTQPCVGAFHGCRRSRTTSVRGGETPTVSHSPP